MRDFPVFTTENGIASIVLREIPYKAEAYITLQDTKKPKELLMECADFCKAAGAEYIYAKGHHILEQYPLHTAIWRMQRLREGLPETDAALFPVAENTIAQWREMYNDRMKNVANAASFSVEDGKKLVKKGGDYFVRRGSELLGIGIVEGDTVEAVVSVKPGCGQDTMLALCSTIFSEKIWLEVASVNVPALKLYEKLGFQKTAELSRWHKII